MVAALSLIETCAPLLKGISAAPSATSDACYSNATSWAGSQRYSGAAGQGASTSERWSA